MSQKKTRLGHSRNKMEKKEKNTLLSPCPFLKKKKTPHFPSIPLSYKQKKQSRRWFFSLYKETPSHPPPPGACSPHPQLGTHGLRRRLRPGWVGLPFWVGLAVKTFKKIVFFFEKTPRTSTKNVFFWKKNTQKFQDQLSKLWGKSSPGGKYGSYLDR